MPDIIKVGKINEIHIQVQADRGLLRELHDEFKFRPPNYKFHPKFKERMWDGYIRLFNLRDSTIYAGLKSKIEDFCTARGYEFHDLNKDDGPGEVKEDYPEWLAKKVNATMMPRDYQKDYIKMAIENERLLMSSPTSSGKSFIIYLLARHYELTEDLRTLIIVPRKALVTQMSKDFVEYGYDEENIHGIMGGVSKDTDRQVVVTTWQSIVKQDLEWFEQFGVIIGDEAHGFEAKSLTDIMMKTTTIKYRFGLTGTVKQEEAKVHQMVLEGLFGPIKKLIKTKELMDRGFASNLKINAIVLRHNAETKKRYKQLRAELKKSHKNPNTTPNYYALERLFLAEHEQRNNFIKKLVWSLKDQNNLILFDLVEKHGHKLKELLETPERTLHYIHGGVDVGIREDTRQIVENNNNQNILASFGTFSTGISIKRIDNVIFASSSKAEVKILQSIGRGLRKSKFSSQVTLYDIGDDLSTSKSNENYHLKHFKDRIGLYNREEFDFKIYPVPI